MKKILIMIFCLGVFIGGCRRTDVRDFEISVPQLTPATEVLIKEALRPYGGVDFNSIRFDQVAKKVYLRYDSMQIAKKNLEMAIAEKGLQANEVTPASIGR